MPKLSKNSDGKLFAFITIIWAWGVLSVPVVLKLEFLNLITEIVYLLAGASPSAIALLFVFLSSDKEYRRSFFRRLIRISTISGPMFLFKEHIKTRCLMLVLRLF
jgi:hypothetical protein